MSKNKPDDLRRCPMCGAPAIVRSIQWSTGKKGWAISCSKKVRHYATPLYTRKHDAKRRWNKRYVEDTLVFELDMTMKHIARAKTLQESKSILEQEKIYLRGRLKELGI